MYHAVFFPLTPQHLPVFLNIDTETTPGGLGNGVKSAAFICKIQMTIFTTAFAFCINKF